MICIIITNLPGGLSKKNGDYRVRFDFVLLDRIGLSAEVKTLPCELAIGQNRGGHFSVVFLGSIGSKGAAIISHMCQSGSLIL